MSATTTSRRGPEVAGTPAVPRDPTSAPLGDEPAEALHALIEEARRRQRRRRAFSALAVVGTVGLVAGLATAFSSPPPKPPPPPVPGGHVPAPRPTLPTVTRTADGLVSWHGPMQSPRAFDTALGLYFAWDVTRPGAGSVHGVLARVDPRTGRMAAIRTTQGTATSVVALHRSLFVALASVRGDVSRGRLVRVDPTTLEVIGSTTLPAEPTPSELVTAGGGVWVATGDRLERVTPASGSVTVSLALPGASSVSLGTDTRGSVLVAAADIPSGAHYLERIDPSTGAVQARAPQGGGDAAVGGIVQTELWIGESSGTMGAALRYSVGSLQLEGQGCHTGSATEACILGTSPRPTIEEGRLYITTPNAPTRNYCAQPDGQAIARLPVDIEDGDRVLAIGRTSLLFQVTTTPRTPTISEVRIPASCR